LKIKGVLWTWKIWVFEGLLKGVFEGLKLKILGIGNGVFDTAKTVLLDRKFFEGLKLKILGP
jgi:hypothetical protein